MWDPRITIEEVNDPAEVERHRERREQFRRNCDWLQAHWPDLLPQALGKFLAVAGQEAFLADTAAEARALAVAKHPEEKGILVEYVVPALGARFYGSRLCSSADSGQPVPTV
jgi:hypothetical protein